MSQSRIKTSKAEFPTKSVAVRRIVYVPSVSTLTVGSSIFAALRLPGPESTLQAYVKAFASVTVES